MLQVYNGANQWQLGWTNAAEALDASITHSYTQQHTSGIHGRRRCYNGANQWQLGWTKAVETLDAGDLKPGVWKTVTIPALTSAERAVVQVRLERKKRGFM